MVTTVTVPPRSCVLAGWGAPAFGQPGGPEQFWLAGAPPTGPNCAGLTFAPLSDYINQQPIGAHALWYEPFAGGGNAGAVAAALDVGPYPQPFTQMDEVYKSLDLLNYGTNPAPLRASLVQLDGEVYADYPSVAIGAGQLFLGAVHTEMRATNPSSTPVRAWVSGIGGGAFLSGTGDSHSVSSEMGGVAGGLERRFDPTLLSGVAVGFATGWFGANGISGSGTSTTFAVTPYARYQPGPWYIEAAVGYGYSWGNVNRSMSFINDELYSSGVTFGTHGSPTGNAFLSQAEAGYRIRCRRRRRGDAFRRHAGNCVLWKQLCGKRRRCSRLACVEPNHEFGARHLWRGVQLCSPGRAVGAASVQCTAWMGA